MKKTMLLLAVLLVCTMVPAAAQGFNPTDAGQVKALHGCLAKNQEVGGGGETEASGIPPWRPAPGPDDDARADGLCWERNSSSNYSWGGCSFSSNGCLDNCYKNEANCTEECSTIHGSENCGVSGSACENCQDTCMSTANSCKSACGF